MTAWRRKLFMEWEKNRCYMREQMFNEPHSCHEHCGTATQHLVVSQHITNTTALFTGHMRMNEYNYTRSRSHIVVCLEYWTMLENGGRNCSKGDHMVGAICTSFDKLPKWAQFTLLSLLYLSAFGLNIAGWKKKKPGWLHLNEKFLFFLFLNKENIPLSLSRLVMVMDQDNLISCRHVSTCLLTDLPA